MFIAISLIALLLACALYQLDKLNKQGEVVLNRNYEVDFEDPIAFGQEFKRRTAALPNHILAPNPLFPDSVCPAAIHMNRGGKKMEQFYFKVRLSDGSFTDVGFWIFKLDVPGRSPTGLSTVLLATDSFVERSVGANRKRNEERHRLEETYRRLQDEVQNDYRAAHRKPQPEEALSER